MGRVMSVKGYNREVRIQNAFARRRCPVGYSMVEVTLSIALLLPLLLFSIFVITQISEYFVLKQQLAFVARQAAKEIAAYGTQGLTQMNAGGSASGAANINDANYLQVVNGISVPGIINRNSASQFSVYFNIPNSPSLTKSYVTATVTYRNGAGLPVYPWNPLGAGFAGIDMSGIRVNSCCSWPIPHT
jgi:type II secretory pathway pseudopilin PulG